MIVLLVCAVLAQAPVDPWYFVDAGRIQFWAPDKVQHYAGSYALAKTIGPAPALALGIAWELYQVDQGGFFSWRDMIADVFGVLAAILPAPWESFILWRPDRREILVLLSLRI